MRYAGLAALAAATPAVASDVHLYFEVPENGTVEVWADLSVPSASYQLFINDPAAEAAFLGGEYDESVFPMHIVGDAPSIYCLEDGDCAITADANVPGGTEAPPGTHRLMTLFFEPDACLDISVGSLGPFDTQFSYQGLPQETTADAGTTCAAAACPGDVNGSGTVDVGDLLEVLAGWGAGYGVNDLLEVLAGWGPC